MSNLNTKIDELLKNRNKYNGFIEGQKKSNSNFNQLYASAKKSAEQSFKGITAQVIGNNVSFYSGKRLVYKTTLDKLGLGGGTQKNNKSKEPSSWNQLGDLFEPTTGGGRAVGAGLKYKDIVDNINNIIKEADAEEDKAIEEARKSNRARKLQDISRTSVDPDEDVAGRGAGIDEPSDPDIDDYTAQSIESQALNAYKNIYTNYMTKRYLLASLLNSGVRGAAQSVSSAPASSGSAAAGTAAGAGSGGVEAVKSPSSGESAGAGPQEIDYYLSSLFGKDVGKIRRCIYNAINGVCQYSGSTAQIEKIKVEDYEIANRMFLESDIKNIQTLQKLLNQNGGSGGIYDAILRAYGIDEPSTVTNRRVNETGYPDSQEDITYKTIMLFCSTSKIRLLQNIISLMKRQGYWKKTGPHAQVVADERKMKGYVNGLKLRIKTNVEVLVNRIIKSKNLPTLTGANLNYDLQRRENKILIVVKLNNRPIYNGNMNIINEAINPDDERRVVKEIAQEIAQIYIDEIEDRKQHKEETIRLENKRNTI